MGPSARRLECKQIGENSIIDDTYISNPASSRVALLALSGMQTSGRRIVVFGEDRGGGLTAELTARSSHPTRGGLLYFGRINLSSGRSRAEVQRALAQRDEEPDWGGMLEQVS